ncbi:hypothetical protein JAAARDRAFT_51462 [Jaapia argillacea MUCL 33604]|uniref:Uncharacterized protein n=1 Tax=Jaapia argillacea MUCL 33604 TaxID=933084 RepID=A0A067PHX5_9AGAM|nr:hypothetical protein JAAARDRAFT_51462 [Jaapia argillacea MUCL 33604]
MHRSTSSKVEDHALPVLPPPDSPPNSPQTPRIHQSIDGSHTNSPTAVHCSKPECDDFGSLTGDTGPGLRLATTTHSHLVIGSDSFRRGAYRRLHSHHSRLEPIPAPVQPTEPVATRSQRERKLSHYLRDLQSASGEGTTSAHPSDPAVPVGMSVPWCRTSTVEDTQDEVQEVTGVEYVLVAEIGEVEALEPKNLAEAKGGPDWLEWENPINDEPKMLEDSGTWSLGDESEGMNVIGSFAGR